MPQLVQEDIGGGWSSSVLPALTGGLNTSKEAWLIEDDECSLLRNVRPSRDTLIVDTGYKTIKNTIAVLGVPRKTFEHVFNDGSRETILITDKTAYKLSATLGWLLISNGVATTTTEIIDPAEVAWDLTSVAGLAIGDVVGIVLTDGRHHVTTISGIAALTITVVAGPPSPGAALGAVVTRGIRGNPAVGGGLSGSADHEVVLVGVPFTNGPTNSIAGTNGVDRPFYYDGTTIQAIPNLPNAGATVCRTLFPHTNRLVLAGILSDGGAARPSKLYWSTIADYISATGWSGVTAGNELLRDTRDSIVAGVPMQEHVILYRDHSIVRMEFMEADISSGTGQDFYFRPMVQGYQQGIGIGAASANAVINYNNAHYVMAQDGIYTYTGGFQVEPFSQKVNEGFFVEGGVVDRTKLHRSFAFYADERNDLFFCFVSAEDAGVYPQRALVFSGDEQAWWERKFFHEMTGAEVHLAAASISWDELIGTWDDQNYSWDSLSGSQQRKVYLTSSTNLLVYEYDFMSGSDAGASIDYFILTKEWRSYDKVMRLEWYQFEYSGIPAFLLIVDGVSYPLVLNFAFQDYKARRYAFALIGERLQFSLNGSGSSFVLSHIAWLVKAESRWARGV